MFEKDKKDVKSYFKDVSIFFLFLTCLFFFKLLLVFHTEGKHCQILWEVVEKLGESCSNSKTSNQSHCTKWALVLS